MTRNKKKNLFIYIFLIVLSVIMIWPFFQMLTTSFMTYEESISTPPTLIPKGFRLDSYKNVFETMIDNGIVKTLLDRK